MRTKRNAEPFVEKYPRLVMEVEECFGEGRPLEVIIRAGLWEVERE